MKVKDILPESKERIVIPIPKVKGWKKTPESGRRGGAHFNPKTDYKRSKEKAKFRKQLHDE